MNKWPEGGTAFPTQSVTMQDGTVLYGEFGMTLRDYFAAKAIPALLSHSGGYWSHDNMQRWAVLAYNMADAMLEARK